MSIEQTYENHGTNSSSGYAAYRETDQDEQVVYDQYDRDKESCETSKHVGKLCSYNRKKSCCQIGWPSKSSNRYSAIHGLNLLIAYSLIVYNKAFLRIF